MMPAPTAAVTAHVVGGPLDIALELGLPLLAFLALYWWSSRKERRPK